MTEHWSDVAFGPSEETPPDERPRPALVAPDAWIDWLHVLFPKHVTASFAPRHHDFWEWVWAIDAQAAPRPFVGVWPRGGGKSTSAELATTALGVKGARRYALYVRSTQLQADKSVGNIAALLESDAIERYYPHHAEREVGKFGNAKGWRRERLMTAGGFTVDAMGLDTAARGVKVEDQRPDLIVFDDIDDKHDSLATTAKKIDTITTSLLPAGAINAAALCIQNLIIPDGFFTRMVDGRADYLAERIVSGPFPAVEGLKIEPREDEETGIRKHIIVHGTASWEGQNLATCQRQIHEWGISAFRKEAQHEVTDRSDSLALRFDVTRHLEDLTDDECRQLVKMGRVFAGIDFGAWRFGFVLRATDRMGRVHELASYFSQREGLEIRAKAIAAICKHYGVTGLRIRGDAANPQDIMEINAAFKREKAPLRASAVAQANKARKASVEKLNDLLDRNAIKYRRNVSQAVAPILVEALKSQGKTLGDFLTWRHGYNASSSGTEMPGSRLQWEVQHWGYVIPREGEAQEQDPDDDTADGADLVAADRYAVMSHLRPAAEEEEEMDDFNPITPALMQEHNERMAKLGTRRKVQRSQVPIDDQFGEF